MRGAALAILLANAAFVSQPEPARLAAGRAVRNARTLDPVRNPPPGWRAIRDRDTGVVARMWGGSVAVPGAMRDPAIAERAARSFVASQLALLAPGARLDEFVVVANRVDGALRTVAFRQTWHGLRVVGGQLHVVFAHDRLFAAGSEALPHVAAPETHGGRTSSARAVAWLRGATIRDRHERVVVPLVRGAGDIEYQIADVFAATARDGRWDVYVAPDGQPLLRVSRSSRATGTLRFDVPERRPTGARVLAPAARANLIADGVATTTADDGGFAWLGNAPATVDTRASGSLVDVIPATGANATSQLVAQPGQAVDWSVATDELADAQLAAYHFGMVGKARAREMHPTLAWLDQVLEIDVNEPGSCNAMSTGDSIHFFLASTECENTGRLADVVLHEFAHSFHTQSIIPGVGEFDAAMSEGIADFFAANITGDSGVGRGLNFDDAAIRDIDPLGIERVFPGDVDPDDHLTGLIIAGALWDLRQALVAELGAPQGIAVVEQLYVGILQRATDSQTAYAAAMVVDDDDGDLGNGTPHGCAIEAAFARHGLVPEFATTTVAPPSATGLDVAVAVTTPTTPCPRPRVTAMTLRWRPESSDAAQALAMAPAVDAATWSATIPLQPDGTVVRYQVTATLDDGTTVGFPDNPADPEYQLFVGTATPLWCERVDADPGWSQTGAMGWDVAPPFGRAGDPPLAFTGVRILGTNVIRDGRYPAGATTAIETPPIDASGYDRVHVQFRRWLTVADGASDRAEFAVNGAVAWRNSETVDHVDQEWRFVDVEIAPTADLRLAWSLASDATRELGGWNLDDICVVGIGKIARCGDGFVDVDEACDDGNLTAGDGCSPTCFDEPDGGCCSSSSGSPGALALGLCVLAILGCGRRL